MTRDPITCEVALARLSGAHGFAATLAASLELLGLERALVWRIAAETGAPQIVLDTGAASDPSVAVVDADPLVEIVVASGQLFVTEDLSQASSAGPDRETLRAVGIGAAVFLPVVEGGRTDEVIALLADAARPGLARDPTLLALVTTWLVRERCHERARRADVAAVRLFMAVGEHAAQGLAVVQRSVFRWLNPALARMVGATTESLVGAYCGRIFAPEALPAVREAAQRRQLAGPEARAEVWPTLLVDAERERRPVTLTICPVFLDGEDIEVWGLLPQPGRSFQEVPESADRAHAFVHKLNNLLSSILGNLALTRMQIAGDGPVHTKLEEAENRAIEAGILARAFAEDEILPCSTPAATVVPAASSGPAARLSGPVAGRVLLMDDEAVIRLTTKEALGGLGWSVDAAAEGGEAVRLYQEALAAGRPYDVVLLDLSVSQGQGGQECLDRLRQLDPAVRAVVASGFVGETDLASWQARGFREAIGKPYRIDDLSQTLHRVIAS